MVFSVQARGVLLVCRCALATRGHPRRQSLEAERREKEGRAERAASRGVAEGRGEGRYRVVD